MRFEVDGAACVIVVWAAGPVVEPPLGERLSVMAFTSMTVDVFWRVVEAFDWSQAGDDDAVVEPALKALAAMPVDEIHAFDDILATLLHALDTREHARYGYLDEADPDNGDDYISADDFLYLRCVVVANGREFYDSVLADPKLMPQNLQFESMLSLASEAFERKTGDDYDHSTPVDYESFANRAGWAPSGGTPGRATGENVPPLNRRRL